MSEASPELKTFQHDKDIALIKAEMVHTNKAIESLSTELQSSTRLLTEKVELMIGMQTDMAKVQSSNREILEQNSRMTEQLNKALIDIDNIKRDLDPIKETVKNVDSVGFLIKHSKSIVFIFSTIAAGFGFYVVSLLKDIQ